MAAKKKATKKAPARSARRAPKKTIRKTAAAKSARTRLGTIVVSSSKLPRIGEHSAHHGGVFSGVVRGENGQPDYCLFRATGPAAESVRGIWGPNKEITGALSEFDGRANTLAMANAGSEIAKKAGTLKIGAHSDYYIAARREARIIASNEPGLFNDGWAWTSTQHRAYSDYAWVQHFVDGRQLSSLKSNEFPAVLVRRVAIQ